jgi:flavin-dependent dehydrogenase
VFPKADHYSVGGFVSEGKLPEIKKLYQDFCGRNGWLTEVETYRSRGHPTALAERKRPLASRRVLLAGEAGNLVDPLTGEGIYYALRSGHLAAQAAAGLLRHGRPLSHYRNRIRREIQEDLRYARFLARFIYRHPALSFRLLLRNSLLCRWFIEVGAGLRTYRSLVAGVMTCGLALPFHRGSGREMEVTVQLPPGRPDTTGRH